MAVKGAIFISRPGRVLAILGFFIFLSAGRSFASPITPDHFNGVEPNPCANWMVSQSGGSFATFLYYDTGSAVIVNDVTDSSPTSIGWLSSDGTSVSITYTDPA